MEFLTFLFEGLVGIFLTSAHALQLSKILAAWQHFLQLDVLLFEDLELSPDVFEDEGPLLLKQVVLLQASPHVSLVLLVVLCDLRLSLLEDFDLKTTLSWPLLPQILIKLLD